MDVVVAIVLARLRALLGAEALTTFVGLAVLVVLARQVARPTERDTLWSPSFRTDLLYTLFYVGGFYGVALAGPVIRSLRLGLSLALPGLRLHLLDGLPAPMQFVVAFVLGDALTYWVHRWSHASPALWRFHSIHHSQTALTPLSNFRLHCVDALVRGAVPALVLTVLGNVSLGTLHWAWLVGVAYALQQGLAHSDLDWGFGWLGRIFVSPRFHRVHHSVEPAEANTNFGAAFSFWDHLFRTANEGSQRPAAFGTPALPIPTSFLGQLAFPFVWWIKDARGPRDR